MAFEIFLEVYRRKVTNYAVFGIFLVLGPVEAVFLKPRHKGPVRAVFASVDFDWPAATEGGSVRRV